MPKKTTTVVLRDIKRPDLGYKIFKELGKFDNEERDEVFGEISKYFEFGEYFDVQIEIDEDMNIVGGKVLEK